MKSSTSREIVAIILAVGLATAVNCITFAVLYDAIMSEGPGLSDNATQVLVGSLGGIIGLLGSHLGYRASERQHEHDDAQRD